MLDIKSLRKKVGDIIQLNEGLSRKEMLMEMPATNYTTFDTLPYIICDAEYYDDEDGNYVEDVDAYIPLEDLLDTKNKYSKPRWLESREAILVPDMNKTLDMRFLCIVAYPGYYDGMTVGIEVRDSDDLFADEFYQSEDEDGNVYWDSDFLKERVYSQEECHEILDRLYQQQIEEAQGIIVKYANDYGARLYPSDFKMPEPEGEGDEFNETFDPSKIDDTKVINGVNYYKLSPEEFSSDADIMEYLLPGKALLFINAEHKYLKYTGHPNSGHVSPPALLYFSDVETHEVRIYSYTKFYSTFYYGYGTLWIMDDEGELSDPEGDGSEFND